MTATAQKLADAFAEVKSRDAAARRVFPWIESLTPEGRSECIRELFAMVEATTSLSNYADFQSTVDDWRGTAENYAAGILPAADDDLDWLDEPEPVGRPL